MNIQYVEKLDWHSPEIATWTVFSQKLQAEMSGSIVISDGGYSVFDPLPFSDGLIKELKSHGKSHGIFLTNGNHERGAKDLADKLSTSTYAPVKAKGEVQADYWFEPNELLVNKEFKALGLEGFGIGETVFYSNRLRLLIIGDAIVNMASRELEVLPEQYCANLEKGIESLQSLSSIDFTLACLAHGEPVNREAIKKLFNWK